MDNSEKIARGDGILFQWPRGRLCSAADYDGDGRTDHAVGGKTRLVFRQLVYFLKARLTRCSPKILGRPSMTIRSGRLRRDGKADLAVFRGQGNGSQSIWFYERHLAVRLLPAVGQEGDFPAPG